MDSEILSGEAEILAASALANPAAARMEAVLCIKSISLIYTFNIWSMYMKSSVTIDYISLDFCIRMIVFGLYGKVV